MSSPPLIQLPPPTVVFVRPQAPGNLGALARVMSNFGCNDFRYTGGFPAHHADGFSKMDWALSRCGESILKAARCYPNLEAALEGIHLVVGSSGRSDSFEKGYARPQVLPGDALRSVRDWREKTDGEFRWAFVLGPEDDGLNRQEASLCQKLVRLPTTSEAPSMNIAMAAGCFLYHWHLANLGAATLPEAIDPGPFAPRDKPMFTESGRSEWADEPQKDRFLDYLMETMGRTKFLKYPDTEAVRARVKRWLQAAPIPLGELLFAFELIYHVRAWGSGKYESRDFLTKNRE